jgi:protein-tyrosine phosphatase
MRRVLFVCTGNIFRSLTAEYALRRALPAHSDVHVSSAGTEDYPHVVWSEVRAYLLEKGLDVRPHVRRTLTQTIIDESDLLVVMGTDHRSTLQQSFGLSAPLYLEACGEAAEGLPDIEEVISDYRTNAAAVSAHVRMTIDRIIELAPRLAERIPVLLRRHCRG